VLFDRQIHSFERFTSKLDDAELNYKGQKKDCDEKWVIKEVLKDVDLLMLELAGVNFVEYL